MTTWLNRLVSHRLRALIQKELNQIKRDRRIMASLILPPILQLMLFGSVMNPSVASINLGVLDGSQTPASRDLVAALSESGSFKLTRAVVVQPSTTRMQGPATRRGIAFLHPALLYNPGGVSTWFIVTGLL